MNFGERIARLIIDEEMKRCGFIRLDANTEARLEVYLEEPELRARFLADAAEKAEETPENLVEAFIQMFPDDYDARTCIEGIVARPFSHTVTRIRRN